MPRVAVAQRKSGSWVTDGTSVRSNIDGLVLVGVVLCLASQLSNCKLSEAKADCLLTKCPPDQSRMKHKRLCVSVVPTGYVTTAEACCALCEAGHFPPAPCLNKCMLHSQHLRRSDA